MNLNVLRRDHISIINACDIAKAKANIVIKTGNDNIVYNNWSRQKVLQKIKTKMLPHDFFY